MIGLVGAALVWLFWSWLTVQNLYCRREPADWGHAYVVPLVSLYVIWQRRGALAKEQSRTYWPGLAVMLLGIACFVFFTAGRNIPMAQGWSMILTLFGAVLLLLGPGYMKHLFLPIAYLVFGVTVAELWMIRVTGPMKLIASEGAYLLLNLVGINTLISGNVLDILPANGGSIPLNVADACAGMRTVIAFMALAGAVSLVATSLWWQRVALMMMAVPVALFMNILRVAALGAASLVNPKLASGQAHTFIGTLTLIPGFFLFMGILWVLQRAARPEAVPIAGGKGGAP